MLGVRLGQQRTQRALSGAASVTIVLALAACARPEPRYPNAQQPPQPGYGQPAQGYPGYGPPPPGAPPPGFAQPGAPAPVPAAGSAPPPGPAHPTRPVNSDPINAVDIQFLRQRAHAIIAELVAALPPAARSRVDGVPLVVNDKPGEVNAFASCLRGKAAMAITDELLRIEANLARAQATDEVFGTAKTDEYIGLIGRGQRPGQPVMMPPPGFFTAQQESDPRRVARQHQLLDEQIAFVLGHELGHHHLGHLPCTAGGGLTAAEINFILTDAVPAFNQPNELAADVAGTNNVLTAGARHQDYRWTEAGGLLTMRFFAGLRTFRPSDLLFGFEHSHPPPQLRTPVIQQTANTWRLTGGAGLSFPAL